MTRAISLILTLQSHHFLKLVRHNSHRFSAKWMTFHVFQLSLPYYFNFKNWKKIHMQYSELTRYIVSIRFVNQNDFYNVHKNVLFCRVFVSSEFEVNWVFCNTIIDNWLCTSIVMPPPFPWGKCIYILHSRQMNAKTKSEGCLTILGAVERGSSRLE